MKIRSFTFAAIVALALSFTAGNALAVGTHEGCTPGYWKQAQHFDSWPAPYTPESNLRDVFVTSPVTLVPDDTFLEALNYGGGSSLEGATRILLRAAVAALLNASSPDVNFEVSTGHVVNTTIDRLESQWRPSLLTRAAYFDFINNAAAGCPLN